MRSVPSVGLIQRCGCKCSASCLYLPSLWTDAGLGMLGEGKWLSGECARSSGGRCVLVPTLLIEGSVMHLVCF